MGNQLRATSHELQLKSEAHPAHGSQLIAHSCPPAVFALFWIKSEKNLCVQSLIFVSSVFLKSDL